MWVPLTIRVMIWQISASGESSPASVTEARYAKWINEELDGLSPGAMAVAIDLATATFVLMLRQYLASNYKRPDRPDCCRCGL